MKTWQIFLLGVAALVVVFRLPAYERAVAAIAAFLIVGAVLAGFLNRPRREVYYVHTTTWVATPDDVSQEHDTVALRVEIARLWLLFIPTFLAAAFLVVTAAQGIRWNFSLIERIFPASGNVLLARILLVVVWGITSTWVSERWTLHHADAACSANSVSLKESRVSYSFVDRAGEYYGGEGFAFRLIHPQWLSILVFYNQQKPEQSKIAEEFLFHRIAIIGRGLTDLDQETAAAHMPALAIRTH